MSLFGNLTAGSIVSDIQDQIDVFKKEKEEALYNLELDCLIKGLELAKDIARKYED